MRNDKKKSNLYVREAIELVAEMFEYAKAHMHIDAKDFMIYFIESGVASEIYNNNLIYIFGKSSIEIVKKILDVCHQKYKIYNENKILIAKKEYWLGLIIASYCFLKKISFDELMKYINIDDLLKKFDVLHEASHERAIEDIDEYIKKNGTKLAKYRQNVGLSQSELSKISGVSLRSIQLYEQRYKDINKANFDNIIKLSKVLKIEPQELYECVNVGNKELVRMY